MRIRKGLAPFVFFAAVILLPAIAADAAVKGSCSVCHTMHNSEQGSSVAFTRDSSGQMVKPSRTVSGPS